jgi:hypothetical protein
VLEAATVKWVVIAGALLALYPLHRLALWMELRGWLYYVHKKPRLDSLGTAFLELQRMAQPEKQYLIEARQKQPTAQEDQGGPEKAGKGGAQTNSGL